MAPRPASGVSRRPERFGGSVRNEKRDELRRALEAFEARVDKNDPEQVAALEAMRAETRELERMRGVWDLRGLPGVQRDWNEYPDPERALAPLEDERFAEYKAHKAAERKGRARLALASPEDPPRRDEA